MEFDGGDGDGELAAAPGNGRKARGKAKAKSGGGGSRPGKGPCVACEEPRHANTKFCKNHKRAYDAMAYQAKKADQNGEDGALAACNQSMQDDFSAKQALEIWTEKNPPDSRYTRKAFIDWADFRKTFGQRTEIIDRSKCKPMWEGEFIQWATTEKALPKSEAEQWWKEFYNNPRIERDNEGPKGRLQLWVPKGQSRLTDKARFSESTTTQGSKPLKDPKASDIEMLQDHVKRQQQSVVDPFFCGASGASGSAGSGSANSASATPQRPKSQPCDLAVTSESPAPTPGKGPVPKRARIDVDRAGPKLLTSMKKDMETLKKNFKSAKDKAATAMTNLDKVDLELIRDDLALFGLLRSLDLRVHFLHRWEEGAPEQTVKEHSFAVKIQGRCAKETGENGENKLTEQSATLVRQSVADFGKMQKLNLDEILQENQARLPLKESEKFANMKLLDDKMQMALSLKSTQEFEALKAEWQGLSGSALSMFASIGKIANDVSEHLNTKGREAQRQETRRLTQERQAALKAIRDQAKAAADEIKAKPKQVTQAPVFGIGVLAQGIDSVKILEVVEDKVGGPWTEPWVVMNWSPGLKCLADLSIKKSLDTFASQYKKLGDPSGRHQYSLQTGAVKDMVDDTLQLAMPSSWFDLAEHGIAGGDKFMAASWFYGYSPGMSFCGLQPNAAAQLRLHYSKGSVQVLLISLTSLCEKMLDEAARDSFTAAHKFVTNMTEETIAACREKGVKMWAHSLGPEELLFLPTGILSIESSAAACGEVCRIRKAFFPLEAESVKEYNTVLTQFQKDGRSIGQMQAILDGLKKATGHGQA